MNLKLTIQEAEQGFRVPEAHNDLKNVSCLFFSLARLMALPITLTAPKWFLLKLIITLM